MILVRRVPRWLLSSLVCAGLLAGGCIPRSDAPTTSDAGMGDSSAAPVAVSLINLIATPERYEGSRVQVVGYLRLDFEGTALFLTRDDFLAQNYRSAVWVSAPVTTRQKWRGLGDKYVLVEGTFSTASRGHDNCCAGVLRDLQGITARDPPREQR